MHEELRRQANLPSGSSGRGCCGDPKRKIHLNGNGRILLLGEARSGTTWLAKIFDSHPDVIYRHEPDIVYRPDCLPKLVPQSEEEAYIGTARDYLDILAAARTLKAAGPLPAFAKRHRSLFGWALRTGFILGARGLEMAARGNLNPTWLPIPDLISRRRRGDVRTVIKSVSLLPHARLFAKAWPEARVIVIVRHPCGQVASFLRGIELGKFSLSPYAEIAESDEAERLGLKMEQFSALPAIEQLAWHWAFFNQRLLQSTGGLSNVKLVVYDELAADPLNVARRLLDFAGLSWDARVERFIRDSTTSTRHHRTRFYSLRRNPVSAANGWRQTLSPDDQHRILAIASRVAIGRSFAPPSPAQARLSVLRPAVSVANG